MNSDQEQHHLQDLKCGDLVKLDSDVWPEFVNSVGIVTDVIATSSALFTIRVYFTNIKCFELSADPDFVCGWWEERTLTKISS